MTSAVLRGLSRVVFQKNETIVPVIINKLGDPGCSNTQHLALQSSVQGVLQSGIEYQNNQHFHTSSGLSSIMEATPYHDLEKSKKYLDDLFKLIWEDAIVKGLDRKTKVIEFKHPHELEEELDLTLNQDGHSHPELLEAAKKVIQYSCKTASPMFTNQLYSGHDPYSLGASWLIEALNTNQHTFEVGPVFVIIEKYMVEKLNSIVGYSDGDGIFTPGGTMANVTALHLARFHHNNKVKQQGMFGMKPLTMFASEQAHYSYKTGALLMGLGMDNVVPVKSDPQGRMIPEQLEAEIQAARDRGCDPFAVVATSGTTVFGAYDPLGPIADVCQRNNVWMHVDAAWGGGVMASEKHKHLMAGVERSDSVLWNGHKWLGVQLQCSALLTKHKTILADCNNLNATYLFQKDKFYDVSYDTGDKSLQCGRKGDATKWWFMWKARGDKGMAYIVDRAYDNARYFTEQLQKRDGFRLVFDEFECTNICFWYIPERLRGQEETKEWWGEVSKIAPLIKEGMIKKGSLMIGYQPMPTKGLVNFFRIIIENPASEYKDMDFIVEEIERLGKDL